MPNMVNTVTPTTVLKRNDNITNDDVTKPTSNTPSMNRVSSLASIASLAESDWLAVAPILELRSSRTARALEGNASAANDTLLPPTPPKNASPSVQAPSKDEASTNSEANSSGLSPSTLKGNVPEFVPQQMAAAIGDQQSESTPKVCFPQGHSISSESGLDTRSQTSSRPPRQPAHPRCTNRFGLARDQEWLAPYHEKADRLKMDAQRESELQPQQEKVPQAQREKELQEAMETSIETSTETSEEIADPVFTDSDEPIRQPLGVEAWLLMTMLPAEMYAASNHLFYGSPAFAQYLRYGRRSPLWMCGRTEGRFRGFCRPSLSTFYGAVESSPGSMPSSSESEEHSDKTLPSTRSTSNNYSVDDDDDDSIDTNPYAQEERDNTRHLNQALSETLTHDHATDSINGESSSTAQPTYENSPTQHRDPHLIRYIVRDMADRAEESSTSEQQIYREIEKRKSPPSAAARQSPRAVPTGPSNSARQQPIRQQRMRSNATQSGQKPIGNFQAETRTGNAPRPGFTILKRNEQLPDMPAPSAAPAQTSELLPQPTAIPTGPSQHLLPTGPKADQLRNKNWRRGS